MRLGLLTALWHDGGRDAARLALTHLVLSHHARTVPDAYRLAVGSEGRLTQDLAAAHGWHYLERPNQPLSDKWQEGLYAMQGKVDAVVITGSDDFLTRHYFRRAAWEVKQGADVVELPSVFFLRARTGTLVRMTPTGQRFGLGRCLSAAFLDSIGWWLWPRDLPHGLDTRSERFALHRATRRVLLPDVWPCAALDVKTSDSGHMWAWASVMANGHTETVDAQAFLRRYYPQAGIESLCQRE